ncbi:hypothetical protein GJ496_006681 [Pomphorhynchus laevis]|nr:hypothetical protein GJ496_006681 [Pomphorhynchus laevis]
MDRLATNFEFEKISEKLFTDEPDTDKRINMSKQLQRAMWQQFICTNDKHKYRLNLNNQFRCALASLKKHEIIIRKAYNDLHAVIWLISEYEQEAYRRLNDISTYKLVDPKPVNVRDVINDFLDEAISRKFISSIEAESLRAMVLRTVIKKLKKKEKEARIILFGLDNAGKTTVLKRLCGMNVNEVAPTFGFEIQTVLLDGLKLNIWDIGGQKSLRPYWSNYFDETDGIVYVVDSTDVNRIGESKQVLNDILKGGQLLGACVIIMANKQDIDGAMENTKIKEMLGLDTIKGHEFYIVSSSAITGQEIRAFSKR